MTDLEQQMSRLGERVARLESRLAELSGRLAEMQYLLAPFIDRYEREVLDVHTEVVEVRRQIADTRLLLGDKAAREAGATETALSRLVRTGEPLPVEEQFERIWGDRQDIKPEELWKKADLQPATADVRALYREIVAHRHPGLADDPEDRERRRAVMRQVDIAYARRDRTTLASVAEAGRNRRNLPVLLTEGAVEGLRSRAAQLETLITVLEGQIFELERGDVARVLAMAYQAHQEGHDLLEALNESLRGELAEARGTLAELRGRLRGRTAPPNKQAQET